eukprot:12420306-Alexandrium_andersonii.AAC.1
MPNLRRAKGGRGVAPEPGGRHLRQQWTRGYRPGALWSADPPATREEGSMPIAGDGVTGPVCRAVAGVEPGGAPPPGVSVGAAPKASRRQAPSMPNPSRDSTITLSSPWPRAAWKGGRWRCTRGKWSELALLMFVERS